MLFWSIFGHFCEKQTSVQTSEKLAFIPSYTAIFLDVWLYLPYPYRHIRQYFSMFGSTFHIHTVTHTAIFLDVWLYLPYPYRHTAIFLNVWLYLPYPYRHTAIFLNVWFNLPPTTGITRNRSFLSNFNFNKSN